MHNVGMSTPLGLVSFCYSVSPGPFLSMRAETGDKRKADLGRLQGCSHVLGKAPFVLMAKGAMPVRGGKQSYFLQSGKHPASA